MIFEAVEKLGSFQIKTSTGELVDYTIKPFDSVVMDGMKKIAGLEGIDGIRAQISLFIPEYKSEHLIGIPVGVLEEMLEYIVEISQGRKRDTDEKKQESKKPLKSSS